MRCFAFSPASEHCCSLAHRQPGSRGSRGAAPRSVVEKCCRSRRRSAGESCGRGVKRDLVTCSAAGPEGGVRSGTDLLGGPKVDIRKDSGTTEELTVEEIPLETELELDYGPLRDALKEGDFQAADDETRAKIIQLAGADAKGRGWVYFTEVQFMPVKDLQTIDQLWRAASNRKFGFSTQKEIFYQNRKLWPKFFKAIDWVVGENNDYRKWPNGFMYTKDAKAGHLPLTNCLRGTQLFEAIMNHPAFDKSNQQ